MFIFATEPTLAILVAEAALESPGWEEDSSRGMNERRVSRDNEEHCFFKQYDCKKERSFEALSGWKIF